MYGITGLEGALIADAGKRLANAVTRAVDFVGTKVRKKFDKVEMLRQADEWSTKYLDQLERRVYWMQILHMERPIPLESIFVPPLFYESIAREKYSAPDKLIPARELRKESGTKEKQVDLDTICKEQRIAILGDPGAGKSTVLKFLALKHLRHSEMTFPIYIELRDLVDEDSSFAEYLVRRSGINTDKDFLLILHHLLLSEDCIVLLDGLDEISKVTRERVEQMIVDWSAQSPSSQIFLTCRTPAYSRTIEGFAVFEASDFEDDQKTLFVQAWSHQRGKPQMAEQLLPLITDIHTLREKGVAALSTSPLLLTLICYLFERDLELPQKRAELYSRCIDVFIRDWDTTRGIKRNREFPKLSGDDRKLLFARVAHFFFLKSKLYFPQGELILLLRDIAEEFGFNSNQSYELLNELEYQHGILVKLGADLYGFSHPTFQEYLTAYQLVISQSALAVVDKFVLDRRWNEVLLLVAGILVSTTPLIESVVENSRLTDKDKVQVVQRIIIDRPNLDARGNEICAQLLRQAIVPQFEQAIVSLERFLPPFQNDSEPENKVDNIELCAVIRLHLEKTEKDDFSRFLFFLISGFLEFQARLFHKPSFRTCLCRLDLPEKFKTFMNLTEGMEFRVITFKGGTKHIDMGFIPSAIQS